MLQCNKENIDRGDYDIRIWHTLGRGLVKCLVQEICSRETVADRPRAFTITYCSRKDIAMDKKYLDFYGNFLWNPANVQKQFEYMVRSVDLGVKGIEDTARLYRRMFGMMEQAGAGAVDVLGTWRKAQEQFRIFYRDYMGLIGLVPLSDHLAVVRQKEEMERRLASREESGHYFRQLLSEMRETYGLDLAKQLNELFGQQTEQFRKTMNSFIDMYKKDSSGAKDDRLDITKQFSDALSKQGEQLKKLFDKFIEQSRKQSSDAKESHQIELGKQLSELIDKQAGQLQKMMDEFIALYRKDLSEAREEYRSEIARQFNNLMDKQNEQVQKLIDSFVERRSEEVASA